MFGLVLAGRNENHECISHFPVKCLVADVFYLKRAQIKVFTPERILLHSEK